MKLGGISISLKLLETSYSTGEQDSSVYDDVEEIFEIFISLTEQEKLRNLLGEDDEIIKYLSISFFHLAPLVKKEHEALASMISFTSNLVLNSKKI